MRPTVFSKQKSFILISFWVLAALKLLYSIFFLPKSFQLNFLRAFALLLFSYMTYLSYKDNKIATLIMGTIIVLSGLATLGVTGLIPMKHVLAKVIFLLIGGYFTYGGILLILDVKSRNGAEKP